MHKTNFISVDSITLKVHPYFTTHPAPQNAGQYFELPGSGQGLSSQPEAYEHDGRGQFNYAAGFCSATPALRGNEVSMDTLNLGNNESLVCGVFPNQDGTFTAMTYTRSKTFKTENGARRWLERNSGE
ncbi:hypothetical protein BvCmsNSNP012_00995 [Escherichia coli]|nr:hypothetical protein BvCmsNSNP012_00995 [Escherichia coli]